MQSRLVKQSNLDLVLFFWSMLYFEILKTLVSIGCLFLHKDIMAPLLFWVTIEVWVIYLPVLMFWLITLHMGVSKGVVKTYKDYRIIRNMCPDIKYSSVLIDLAKSDWKININFPKDGYSSLAFYAENLKMFHVEKSQSEILLVQEGSSKANGPGVVECPSRYVCIILRSIKPTMTSEDSTNLHNSFIVTKLPERGMLRRPYWSRFMPLNLFIPFLYFGFSGMGFLYFFGIPIVVIGIAHFVHVRFSEAHVNNWCHSCLSFDESNYSHLVIQVVGPLALAKSETHYMIYNETLDANQSYKITIPKELKEKCFWFSVTAIDWKYFVFTRDLKGKKYTSSKLTMTVSKNDSSDIVIPSERNKFRLVLRCYNPVFDVWDKSNAPTVVAMERVKHKEK